MKQRTQDTLVICLQAYLPIDNAPGPMHLGVGVTNSQIQKHTNLETHTPKFFWSRILFGWFSSSPPLFLTVAGSDNLCPHHHKISAQNHVWNNWVWEKNESEAGVGGSHWRSQHYHYLCLLSSSICWMHKTVFFMICRLPRRSQDPQ